MAVVVDLSAFDAFVFDLDGVITMTAGLLWVLEFSTLVIRARTA